MGVDTVRPRSKQINTDEEKASLLPDGSEQPQPEVRFFKSICLFIQFMFVFWILGKKLLFSLNSSHSSLFLRLFEEH